tara:strand:- start:645 stop:791 length:147 start_codon:yes stop_codon:yes gene_type:complete
MIPYWLMKIMWFFDDLFSIVKQLIFLQMYKRHLKKRIEKNNFGRREEW